MAAEVAVMRAEVEHSCSVYCERGDEREAGAQPVHCFLGYGPDPTSKVGRIWMTALGPALLVRAEPAREAPPPQNPAVENEPWLCWFQAQPA